MTHADIILHFDKVALHSDLFQNAMSFSKLDSHLISPAADGHVPVVVRFAADWSHNT
jgi:hypothetical protein